MYAIIESGGKQYKVSAGDSVKVERVGAAKDEEITIVPLIVVDGDRVLTGGDGDSVKVTARVLREGKRRKVLVFHKKRRKHYKKLRGHRQVFTELKILDIIAG